MSLAPGTLLGPYEILAPLGAGGMGEVYRARDARLTRDVALKVLPEDLARDPVRRQRFEQEARAVAALNHPNIVAVYDVGENFFVSELVDGESLRAAGSMPARRVIGLAVQIADGLAAAHAHGVTHRDLKPENIMVSRDGRAKILDFGLAKVVQTSRGADAATQTQEGVVMGTVGYMSPEQVRGVAADPRSDIFSFGLVLYEMLGGKRAFTGASSIEVMSAILKEDPAELPEAVPTGLRLIVEHCLEKSPDRRFQSARDLAFALQSLSGSGAVTATAIAAAVPGTPERKLWPAVVGIVILIALAAAFWFGRSYSKTPAAGAVAITSPPALPSVAAPVPTRAPEKPASPDKPRAEVKKQLAPKLTDPPAANEPKENPPPVPAASAPAATAISGDAQAAYDEAMRLFNDENATEAIRHFDDAIRINPNYLEAYLGRAGARRTLRQYELSIADCGKVIQLDSADPKGYNCRGFGYNLLEKYEPAVRDLTEAIRLNPNFGIAFEHRANAYTALQQYEKAVQDYTQTLRVRPRDADAYIRRAGAYTSLKQYDKAVQDYTEAIRFQPNNFRPYNLRASVEELLGDATGAAADRRHARELRKK